MDSRLVGGALALVVIAGGALGYYERLDRNTVPLTQQIVQAGYAVTELTNPACANFNGKYDCDDTVIAANSKDVLELTYHPAGSPGHCTFRFTQIGAGVTHKSSWRFSFYIDEVDGITPGLGTSDRQRGGTGDGWGKDDEGRRSVSISTPSPKRLWTFVEAHLPSPDEKCKPRQA